MALENNNLDRKIKEALENLSPEFTPKSWDILEERLNTDDIFHSSEDKNSLVDGLVQQKLSNLTMSTQADWSLFEEKLEASEIAEFEEIDQLAYNSLNQFEAPYQSSHWQLMLKRIEEELTLRGKLYKYKVAEVALMLLLIFTFLNLHTLDHFPINLGSNKAKDNIENLNPIPVNKPVLNNYLVPQLKKEEDTKTIKKAAMPIADNTLSNKIIHKTGKPYYLKNQNHTNKSISQEIDQEIIIDDLTISRNDLKTPNQLPIPLQLIQSDVQYTIADNLLSDDEDLAMVPMIGSLMALELSLLDDEDPKFELNQPRIKKLKPDWRFSIFSAIDLNHVYTPFDQTFGTPEYTSIAGGYGGGVSIGLKLKRWVFESGGLYSFKRYIPEPFGSEPFQPTALFTENFKGVQLDILQVPFNIQYHVINQGKWRLYLNTGASLHMILSPVYELERTWIAPPMPAPLPEGCDTCLPSVKGFPKGILDGGSFKDNSYGTVNAGFGVERFFNQRWSIFIQPTYQHYFTKEGVGPNQDKIYSGSILLGTKVSLK